ncbi:aspartate/glutamate racemase family protein [Chelatococcus sp. GCM10030263]|uniref:aspartate/glutamate racemase family protein n=1 Tax=Chelatococcus sp. GCM10030263 TaxID=3273387 RepID=UPI00361B11E4
MNAPLRLNPRIMLIHALREAVAPIHAAFNANWPAARIYDVLDTSLSDDLAADGSITPGMIERFRSLGSYAAGAGSPAGGTDAVLFTCSAFGAAIDAVKADLAIPVLKPNEAAFRQALDRGPRIALIVTFPPALPAMATDMRQLADTTGSDLKLEGCIVEGALDALKAGDAGRHDALIADAVRRLPPVDAVVLGHFSMARAAGAASGATAAPVITTPDSAVSLLRSLLAPSISSTGQPYDAA